MSSVAISPRTNQRSLSLPDPEVQEYLPDAVKQAIAASAEVAVKLSELATVVNGEDVALGNAWRADVQARADAVQSGRPDPGVRHTEAVQRQVAEARKRLPVLEELHARSIVAIQRAAQSCGDLELRRLADQVYSCRRAFIQATEIAQAKKGEEMRAQGALGWYSALVQDESLHRLGKVQLGDLAATFDMLRTQLTRNGRESSYYSWEGRRDNQRAQRNGNGSHASQGDRTEPEVDQGEGTDSAAL